MVRPVENPRSILTRVLAVSVMLPVRFVPVAPVVSVPSKIAIIPVEDAVGKIYPTTPWPVLITVLADFDPLDWNELRLPVDMVYPYALLITRRASSFYGALHDQWPYS